MLGIITINEDYKKNWWNWQKRKALKGQAYEKISRVQSAECIGKAV